MAVYHSGKITMYRVYLGDVMLPIAPESFKIKIKNNNTTLKLLNDGELNVLKAPGLTEISFKVILPSRKYSFAEYTLGYKSAQYYISFIEKLKTNRSVFDLCILRSSDMSKNICIKTTMEDYTLSESYEDAGDIVADINLKQYIAFCTKTVTIKNNESTTESDRDTSSKKDNEEYTIKDGDTLWDIAAVKLGDGTRWEEIYELNKSVLDKEAESRGLPSESGNRWIFTGTVIKIPK